MSVNSLIFRSRGGLSRCDGLLCQRGAGPAVVAYCGCGAIQPRNCSQLASSVGKTVSSPMAGGWSNSSTKAATPCAASQRASSAPSCSIFRLVKPPTRHYDHRGVRPAPRGRISKKLGDIALGRALRSRRALGPQHDGLREARRRRRAPRRPRPNCGRLRRGGC